MSGGMRREGGRRAEEGSRDRGTDKTDNVEERRVETRHMITRGEKTGKREKIRHV